jgi:hypothetical protein
MKWIVLLFVMISLSFGQANYSGYGDTVAVSSFNADSASSTRAFELSKYEDILLYVMADDTSSAGYDSDSIHFHWGIEFLDVVKNSSGVADTAVIGRIVCDTFDILTAANLVVPVHVIDTTGGFNWFKDFIDTTGVSGYAIQHSAPVPYWAPIFKFWYAGLGNNVTGSYIPMVFGQSRRLYINVRDN